MPRRFEWDDPTLTAVRNSLGRGHGEPVKKSAKTIAVIGGGISGLSAAWLLSRRYDVMLFERELRFGGHSNTVEVVRASGETPVDTGFVVYNIQSYPNLIALFDHLGVATARSDMSFAVSLDDGAYEYSGTGLGGLFGQPSNALRPSHLRMLLEIRRFFRQAPGLLAGDPETSPTLAEYLKANRYSAAFVAHHILPMAEAIWSAPPSAVMVFPVVSFVRFFANHGLLQIKNRPEWRTVVGGSRSYVSAILADFGGRVALGRGVSHVRRSSNGVAVTDNAGRTELVDACVVAVHANEALELLADADSQERAVLGAFAYQNNRAVLHADPALMPKRRRVWSSWNYLGSRSDAHATPSVTYWMNRLQTLETEENIFVTLNPIRPIAERAQIAAFDYSHPMFDAAAIAAQRQLWSLQGRSHTWFCGSYFGYGFHEDGLQSGLAVAEDIGGVRRPWTVANESGRLHLGGTRASSTRHEAAE